MADLYDFSNPVMMANIVNPDGEQIPLWTNSFEDGVTPPLPVLTDLSIEILLNQLPIITATLAGPFEYMMKFLSEERIQFGFSNIQVQFGYVGSKGSAILSPVYSGLLTTPDVSISAEEVSVSLVGQGGFSFSATRTQAAGQYENQTRLQIIKALAAGPDPDNPRKVVIDASEVTDGPAATKLKKEVVAAGAPGAKNEWMLIQRYIKESMCWFSSTQEDLSKPLVLKLIPIDKRWIEKPAWRFQMFPGDVKDSKTGNVGLGPATGVYPILSFNTPTSSIFYPCALTGMRSAGIGDGDGEVKKNNLDDKDTHGGEASNRTGPGGQRMKGGVQVEPNKLTGAGMDVFHADDPDSPEHLNKMHTQSKSQYKYGGLKVEIDSIGIPDLTPGRSAQVAGLGPMFDWNYGIHSVTHTLGTGGFSTHWEGYYRSSAIQGQVVKAAGRVANPEADPGEGDSASTEGGSGT